MRYAEDRIVNSEKNMNDNRIKKQRNFSWLSLGLGFSIFPIMFLAGPIMKSLPRDNETSIYIGMFLGLFVILLQVTGFVFGLIGIVRGPKRIMSGLGTLVCFVFCIAVIVNFFK